MSESGRRTTYGTSVGGGSVVTQSFETEVSKLPPSTSTTTQLIQSNSLHNSSQSLEDDVEFYYFYKVYNTYNIFPPLCIFFLTISLYFSLTSLSLSLSLILVPCTFSSHLIPFPFPSWIIPMFFLLLTQTCQKLDPKLNYLNLSLFSLFLSLPLSVLYPKQEEQLTFLWILFATIVIGNTSVLISTSLRSNNRKSRMNFFIKNLAIAGKKISALFKVSN